MGRLKELEEERTTLMAGTRTHSEWVQVMERLAEISAEILLQPTTPEGEPVIGLPPISTEEQKRAARIKLNRMNQFKKEITHASI